MTTPGDHFRSKAPVKDSYTFLACPLVIKFQHASEFYLSFNMRKVYLVRTTKESPSILHLQTDIHTIYAKPLFAHWP